MPGQDSEETPLLPHGTSANPLLLAKHRKAIILLSTWTAVFLGALDTTIVATLVGPISSSFNASHQASWLGTSFLATLAGFTPAYGRVSDIYGRRPVMLVALTLFTIGTAGCALSQTMLQLVIARGIAGCGGGGLMALSSIIASDLVLLKKRGLIQGTANLFYGLGSALGGPVGGLVSEHLGWRAAFMIQVPILALSALLIFTFVRYDTPAQQTSKATKPSLSRVDWSGALTILLAVSSLLVCLSFKTNENRPISDPRVWATGASAVFFLLLFIFCEIHVAKEPVLPMRLMTARSPRATLLVNFLCSSAGFSILYYYPLFQQAVLKQSSSEAGMHLIPNSIAASIGSLGAGWIMRHTGKFWWLTLFSVLAPTLGLVPMIRLTLSSPEWQKWLDITPTGLGMASATTCALIALISGVPRKDIAVATAASYLFRYTGQVVGVAVSSAVLQFFLNRDLHARITGPGAEELIKEIRRSTTIIPKLPEDVQVKAALSYQSALHTVFTCNLVVVLLSALCTLQIKESPLPGSPQEEEEIRRKTQGHVDADE